MKPVCRALAIWVGVLICIGILLPAVSSQVEFTNGVIAFRNCPTIDVFNGCYGVSLPYDMRVACADDNSECVALVYEHASGIRSVRVKYSVGNPATGEHFQNLAYGCPSGIWSWWDWVFGWCSEVGTITDDFTNELAFRNTVDTKHLPYDVIYDEDTNTFNIIVDNVKYTYNSSGLISQGATTYHAYSFIDSEYFISGDVWGNGAYTYLRTYKENFDTGSAGQIGNKLFCDCSSYTCNVPSANYHYGIVSVSAIDDTTYIWEHTGYVEGVCRDAPPYCRCLGYTVTDGTFSTNMPTTYSGLDYYAGGKQFYQRFGNETWIATSTDLATFPTYYEYYEWDTSANESINISDADINTDIKLTAYEYFINDTTIDGIYVYNEKYYGFKVLAKGTNLNTLSAEDLSVSATIVCSAQNYSYTVSGVNPLLITPCQTGNTIVITAGGGWQPNSITISDLTALSTTGYTYVRSATNNFGWVNQYNFTIGVFDSFSGDPVDGATVIVGGTSKVTDSSGYTAFDLAPYDTATFTMTNTSNTYYLSLSGNPADYFAEVSKSQYISDSFPFKLTEVSEPISVTDFNKIDTIQLDPIHAQVYVDVYWKDGVHYEGDTAVVRMGGAQNGTYVNLDGILTPINYATEFPALFVHRDDRASWTANINLTTASEFQSDTIAIVNTTYAYTYTFFLTNTSAYQECYTDLGCESSFCKGSIWYSDGSCEGGVCVYDLESCVLCDDDAGCYTSTTSETCPSGLDVECYGMNYCIDSKYLASFKCSSAKLCYQDTVECGYICDEDEDVCIPADDVTVCDQSTVTGMLTCLQAGMIGFIGSAYDPAFVIFLVIFISVLLVTLLALAVKGVLSSLR